MPWHKVDGAEDLQDGEVTLAVIMGKRIALARDGDHYAALDATCPHAGGPLSEGSVVGGTLVCPWHGREFDLKTGECPGFQGVKAYPVETRGDGIFIET